MISHQQQSLRETDRRERTESPGLWNGTLYLARRELRRTWRSYIWALGIAPVMGVAAAFMVSEDFQLSPVTLNVIFILLIAALPRTSAWHSGERGWAGWTVSSNSHLSFLRSLPLTGRQIAAARALVSVVSVLALCATFFAPLYALSGPLREGLGVTGFLLFAAFWVGYALAFEAVGLFTELGLLGRVGFWAYLVLIWFAAGAIAGSTGQQEVSAVEAVSGLTRSYGALPALAALGGGCGALALSWLATSARLRKKELG